jgi:4-hydroxy-tetrahydrodipicolinate reductase
MGRMLIEAVHHADDCTLSGALDIAASPGIGLDASGFLGVASGVTITSDIRHALKGSHVLIDFTRPEGTMAHLALCREMGVKMVIGTTGFSDEQKPISSLPAKTLPSCGPPT